MGIRSKFKGKNTKKCILKAVLKKNATVVVKVCPKNYLFCIPTIFLPQLCDIFTQKYLPYLWHFATLGKMLFNLQKILQTVQNILHYYPNNIVRYLNKIFRIMQTVQNISHFDIVRYLNNIVSDRNKISRIVQKWF